MFPGMPSFPQNFFKSFFSLFSFMIYKGKIVGKIILLFNLFYQTTISYKKITIRKMLWCTLWVALKRDSGWQGSGDHWLGDLYQARHPRIEESSDREEILYFMEVQLQVRCYCFPLSNCNHFIVWPLYLHLLYLIGAWDLEKIWHRANRFFFSYWLLIVFSWEIKLRRHWSLFSSWSHKTFQA